jgi:hypothetical protein
MKRKTTIVSLAKKYGYTDTPKTYLLHITDSYKVRFTGTITRWQKLCLWLAGIDVVEVSF